MPVELALDEMGRGAGSHWVSELITVFVDEPGHTAPE